jgi:hypothetical protein
MFGISVAPTLVGADFFHPSVDVPIMGHLRSLITKHFLRPSKNLEIWHRKSKIDSAPENEFYFKNNNRDRKKNKI